MKSEGIPFILGDLWEIVSELYGYAGEGGKAYFNNRLLSLLKQYKNDEVIRMFESENPRDLVDLLGKSLLHLSVEYGNIVIMNHLISLGANVDAQDKQGNTPLAIAIKKGRVKSIVGLLKANANIYVADEHGKMQLLSMILRYAKKMPCDTVNLFFERIRLNNSADVEMITQELIAARCPLYHVVLLKNSSILKVLLDRGFPIRARCRYNGNTVLHVAVQFSVLESVKLLIERGVDVNTLNHLGETALMMCAASNFTNENLEILKILLSRGTCLTACNVQGKMQMYTVLKFGNKSVVREVLRNIEDLTVKDTFGQTALHYLMENTNPEIIDELKGKKFDVNAIDNFGKSALHLAAERAIASNISFLLSIDANVNISQGTDNITPLFSILNSKVPYAETKKCTDLLLRHGADIQFVTNQNRTIFDIILEYIDHNNQNLENNTSNDMLVYGLYHKYYVIKPILAYLALSELRGTTTVTQFTRSKIDSSDLMKRYFNFCRRKLKVMKKNIAPSLSVIFFRCLGDSKERIMRIARDRKLALKLSRAIDKFPMRTRDLIRLRKFLAKALRISKLKKGAIPNLCKIESLRSNRVVVDKIISYLSEKDLRILNQI